jgi:hypothetical protein
MVASIDEALATEFPCSRSAIGMLCFKPATYERLESVPLLELTLWKVKIDSCKALHETDHQRDEGSSPKCPRLEKSHLVGVDRQSYRINSFVMLSCRMCCVSWTKFVEDYIAPEPSF